MAGLMVPNASHLEMTIKGKELWKEQKCNWKKMMRVDNIPMEAKKVWARGEGEIPLEVIKSKMTLNLGPVDPVGRNNCRMIRWRTGWSSSNTGDKPKNNEKNSFTCCTLHPVRLLRSASFVR